MRLFLPEPLPEPAIEMDAAEAAADAPPVDEGLIVNDSD